MSTVSITTIKKGVATTAIIRAAEASNCYFRLMIVYGITNCDTVKKALTWLKNHQIDYTFHDFKKDGKSAKKLKEWDKKAGLEKIVNKKSITWKEADDSIKDTITSIETAVP